MRRGRLVRRLVVGRRRPRARLVEHLVGDRAQDAQDHVGVGAAVVGVPDPLGEDVPGEVDRAHREVVDVHLGADGDERAARGDERDGGAPGTLGGDGVELGEQAARDEPVDERGDGRARESGGRGDVGAGRWGGARRRRAEHLAQHETQVELAQGALPRRRTLHGLDPSRSRA
ncbi:hypothetical protein [Cellulomonas sp. PSBB021]|uniref:hypothetical protein n=1 Tax=Cellulomonas sp. PSBB021 TaxID=2003551 RepID=UPI001E3DDE7E|nr:hypothetical protein [Cellulomonas sp. PSBB021]